MLSPKEHKAKIQKRIHYRTCLLTYPWKKRVNQREEECSAELQISKAGRRRAMHWMPNLARKEWRPSKCNTSQTYQLSNIIYPCIHHEAEQCCTPLAAVGARPKWYPRPTMVCTPEHTPHIWHVWEEEETVLAQNYQQGISKKKRFRKNYQQGSTPLGITVKMNLIVCIIWILFNCWLMNSYLLFLSPYYTR